MHLLCFTGKLQESHDFSAQFRVFDKIFNFHQIGSVQAIAEPTTFIPYDSSET